MRHWFLVGLLLCFSVAGRAASVASFVSILWPGVSAGVRVSDWVFEGRWQFMSGHSDGGGNYDTSYVGLRGSKGFPLSPRVMVYTGLEAGRFSYSADRNFKTNGMTLGAFVGLEKFFNGPFSVALDVGPYYAETKPIEEESGTEFDAVLNVAVRWNFEGKK